MDDKNAIQFEIEENEMAKCRTSLSINRTILSITRTNLSNTQMMLSFVRTFVSVFAAGIGMMEFVDNSAIQLCGKVFMAISPFFLILGIIKYVKTNIKIDEIASKEQINIFD